MSNGRIVLHLNRSYKKRHLLILCPSKAHQVSRSECWHRCRVFDWASSIVIKDSVKSSFKPDASSFDLRPSQKYHFGFVMDVDHDDGDDGDVFSCQSTSGFS